MREIFLQQNLAIPDMALLLPERISVAIDPQGDMPRAPADSS
jgi:hypothetical protein